MFQACYFENNGLSIPELADATARWFADRGFSANVYPDPYGRTLVEAHKEDLGRSIFGLAAALTVAFTMQDNDRVLVEFGGGVWGDKVASGAVGFFLFPPLLITSLVGAWQQNKLDDEVTAYLNTYIFQRTGRYPQYAPAVPYAPYPVQPPNYSAPGNWQGYYNPGYAPQGEQPPAGWPTPQTTYGRATWFDAATLQPVFNTTYSHMPTWQSAIADGVIKPEEIEAQEKLVAQIQGDAEVNLDNAQRIMLASILSDFDKLEQLQK
jgi:hypothetical protein